MTEIDLFQLATRVGQHLKSRNLMLVTAESCTGGWVGEAVTAVAGSSTWFERGFITYSNRAKEEMLGVSSDTLERFGAVGEATVQEMARGALRRGHGQVAVAVSGVAGPDGGTVEKPVGTVCFAWALAGGAITSATHHLPGDRYAVRKQSVAIALQGILDRLDVPGRTQT